MCHRSKFNKESIICDIADIKKVNKIVEDINPAVIINCIGVLNKPAEHDIKSTVYINSFFQKFLARIGEIKNIKIIHLSTDCVFDGKKGNYTEKIIQE